MICDDCKFRHPKIHQFWDGKSTIFQWCDFLNKFCNIASLSCDGIYFELEEKKK